MLNTRSLWDMAQSLGVSAQKLAQHPGAAKASQSKRQVQITQDIQIAGMRHECSRQVRSWAAGTATEMVLQSTSFKTSSLYSNSPT